MRRPRSSDIILGLLCVMYFITYVDRVNLATAASEIRRELSLSNTQLGLAFSAFGYPYILFQIFGGWVGDRFGPRLTLFLCGLVWATATILTGLVGSLVALFFVRLLLGVGEGATFPVATRAMHTWVQADRRGFAQGITHAFARFGNAITPPLIAMLVVMVTWRGSFVVLGCVSLVWVVVWVVYFRDVPSEHKGVTPEELAELPGGGRRAPSARVVVPWRRLTRRMLPVTIVYFCYGWTLWLFLNWLPSFFLHEYGLDMARSAIFSSAVFFAGVGGDILGGVVSDSLLRRTGNLRRARRDVVVAGFLGAFVFMLPIFTTRQLPVIVISLAAALFCAEIVIGPMWAVPMDIAAKYSGTASGIMNTGSAVAAVLSPLAFGYIADVTGNWHTPFIGSLGLLLLGALLAFTMHPEQGFEDQPSQAQLETVAVRG
jgi:sugar phosphate permease